MPYLVDAENIPTEVLSQLPVQTEPIITVGDLLNIDVASSNMVAVVPFNKGSYVDEDGRINRVSNTSSQIGSSGGFEMLTSITL